MTDDRSTEAVELTLEETGWLMHLMMKSAIDGNPRNPIIEPMNDVEYRKRELYHKLHLANHKLMHVDE